jgi:thiamine pyrophosphate-dependent acetolactate synthase large subunit-like protein
MGYEARLRVSGDGINGIVTALGRVDPADLEFVQVRHEEEAAFMASGHAKLTGEVGVCLATSGPGAIHLLNGLYDAKLDRKPVVAIVSQQARASLGGHFQQEVDLLSLFKDVASDYVQVCTAPQQTRHLIDRAMRIAKSQRTVTAIIFPNDVQEADAVEPGHIHGTIHTGADFTQPRALPLGEAARLLELYCNPLSFDLAGETLLHKFAKAKNCRVGLDRHRLEILGEHQGAMLGFDHPFILVEGFQYALMNGLCDRGIIYRKVVAMREEVMG